MKKTLLLQFSIFMICLSYGQQTDLALSKYSRNTDLAIKAFSLENLKYYAKISKKHIEIAMASDDINNCYTAYDLAESAQIHLETALGNNDFATAQSHLMKVKELTMEIYNAYNRCSLDEETEEKTATLPNTTELSALEQLKKQQAELKLKEEAIKKQLKQQEQKQLQLQKKNFVTANESALKNNIKSYNSALKACNCQATITFKNTIGNLNISEKTIKDLKAFYLQKSIALSQNYLNLLNACKAK